MSQNDNSWVLVTGAAQRIGRAIALELASAGWNIIVHFNKSHEKALNTARDIEALGQQACLAELDLADLSHVKRLIPALCAELGPIAALVNNASVFLPDKSEPNFAMHMTINTEAPHILSQIFKKQASKKTSPVIVNILDADPTAPAFSFYNASKKALREMTLDMAKRFAPDLRVNGVALGPILIGPRQSNAHWQKLIQKTPLQKTITPQVVASTVRFLIETSSITGAIVPVDGGLHLKSKKS